MTKLSNPARRKFLKSGAAVGGSLVIGVSLPGFNGVNAAASTSAMNAWVRDGVEPPPSRYPRIDGDQAVALSAVAFLKIPGVSFPTRIQTASRLDFSVEPPKVGGAFPMLVPQVDTDGNETSGVRGPLLEWPLGTYTGWNLRAKEIGAPDELYSMVGSWIPFARSSRCHRQVITGTVPTMIATAAKKYASSAWARMWSVCPRSIFQIRYAVQSPVTSSVAAIRIERRTRAKASPR